MLFCHPMFLKFVELVSTRHLSSISCIKCRYVGGKYMHFMTANTHHLLPSPASSVTATLPGHRHRRAPPPLRLPRTKPKSHHSLFVSPRLISAVAHPTSSFASSHPVCLVIEAPNTTATHHRHPAISATLPPSVTIGEHRPIILSILDPPR
jgi:hypothetical protein